MRVVYAQTALDDLSNYLIYLLERTSAEFAADYVGKIEDFCETLASMPLRGTARSSNSRRYRFVVFKQNIVVAYSVEGEIVTILSILTKGRKMSL